MKSVLLKTFAWLAVALACHLAAALFADGRTDEYYLRSTGEQRPALVLGSSRAAQGIDPTALNDLLPEDLRDPGMLNFSFTIGHSPYGPTYLEAIRKKLDPATQNGLFILCVDPWALSAPKGNAQDVESAFPEEDRMLGKQWIMNGTPNLEYLVRNYAFGWGRIMRERWFPPEPYLTLHENGRLEVHVSLDSLKMAEALKKKVDEYTDHAKHTYSPSLRRIAYLERTIELLQQHGQVVLLRLPLHPAIQRIEEDYWPGFNSLTNELASDNGLAVIDHTALADELLLTDGLHLAAASVPSYSRRLARDVGAVLKGSR